MSEKKKIEKAAQTSVKRNMRKVRQGKIISTGGDKTVTVKVDTKVKDPIYGKYVKKSKKFRAHDEKNRCQLGDHVMLMETRPISATKRWRVTKILNQGKAIQQ